MKPGTEELIQEFIGAPWFENVGRPLEAEGIVRVDTLEWAIKSCTSLEWRDTFDAARNGLTGKLFMSHRERFQDWNRIHGEADERLRPDMEMVIGRLREQYDLPEMVGDCLLGICEVACLESEYSDLLALGFFSELGSWILEGRFPCGLEGKYPEGKLMVY